MTIGTTLKLFEEIPGEISILRPDEYSFLPAPNTNRVNLIVHKNDDGHTYTNMNRNVKHILFINKRLYILLSGFYGENKNISLEEVLAAINLDTKVIEIIDENGENIITLKTSSDYRGIITDRTLCRSVTKIKYSSDGTTIKIHLDSDIIDLMNMLFGCK